MDSVKISDQQSAISSQRQSAIVNQQSAIQSSSHARRGQSSMEMVVALVGALIILFGGVKIALWGVERLVDRYRGYDSGIPLLNQRVLAGNSITLLPPIMPVEPAKPLQLFANDAASAVTPGDPNAGAASEICSIPILKLLPWCWG